MLVPEPFLSQHTDSLCEPVASETNLQDPNCTILFVVFTPVIPAACEVL